MSSDRPRDEEEADTPVGGILGNLPRERPGKRSPRREATRAKAEAADEPPLEATGASGVGGGTQIKGVEDLAWAGVAIAAEAATLGLRLAGRAIDAVRGPTERS